MQETQVWSPGWEDPLDKELTNHSSILAWEIPWTQEPSRLQSMRSQRVRHDLAAEHAHGFLVIVWRVSCVFWIQVLHQTHALQIFFLGQPVLSMIYPLAVLFPETRKNLEHSQPFIPVNRRSVPTCLTYHWAIDESHTDGKRWSCLQGAIRFHWNTCVFRGA